MTSWPMTWAFPRPAHRPNGQGARSPKVAQGSRCGYRNAYAQVKCATHLDAEGHIVCTAHYPKGKVPSHPRFIYIFCLLDEMRMELTRIWVVPSRDFNRLAYREQRGEDRVQLLFECLASGDRRWDRFEVSPDKLGGRFIELIERTNGQSSDALPGLRISLRS